MTSPAQAPEMLAGIDVSRYQGEIDWPRVAASGIALAYVRVSGGDGYVDPMGIGHLAACRRTGLRAGAYHYLTGADAVAQARHFLDTVALDAEALPPRLPPMLDLERADAGPGPLAGAHALAWLRAVEDALGVAPLLYTGPAFARDHDLPVVPGLARYPLWIAHYGAVAPVVPSPWADWAGWQHSGHGACPGIRGPADLSWWRAMPGES